MEYLQEDTWYKGTSSTAAALGESGGLKITTGLLYWPHASD